MGPSGADGGNHISKGRLPRSEGSLGGVFDVVVSDKARREGVIV